MKYVPVPSAAVLVAILVSTPASAQSFQFQTPMGVFRFNVPPGAVPPGAPPPGLAPPGQPAISSSRPSFDCAKARGAAAIAICRDPGGAAADWDLNASGWARKGLLSAEEAAAFDKDETAWINSLSKTCHDSGCFVRAYHGRAASYRKDMPPDALAEATASVEKRWPYISN